MKLTVGHLTQTSEAKFFLDLFGLAPGEELPIHVNFFHVEGLGSGYLLSLPEFPSLAIH